MTHRMSEFQDIDPGHVVKLREAGIENTDDMLRLWADQSKHNSLMAQTGIELDRFTNLVSMSRVARVNNVGPKYVGVLLAAGIDGPKSLFEYTPEALVKRLTEVATEKKLTTPVPTLEQVGPWFGSPKPAAPVAPVSPVAP